MNKEDTKRQIIDGLNQTTTSLLIERLAEVLVENDALKEKIEELQIGKE